MGVRVRLRIKSAGKTVETTALVNTGFETEQPEILLPANLAENWAFTHPPKAPPSKSIA